ncbi:Hypothetical_protein [Hexamita inflata]|uniref:Hypothetical_protein n=1 Tax=Hexamita inflata TaxID=28002 RepID=A0AA86URI6_9EUKA|nr:Hypothetical protein HINF_LOCUS49607 [Hexamita inflata]
MPFGFTVQLFTKIYDGFADIMFLNDVQYYVKDNDYRDCTQMSSLRYSLIKVMYCVTSSVTGSQIYDKYSSKISQDPFQQIFWAIAYNSSRCDQVSIYMVWTCITDLFFINPYHSF